MDCFGEQFGDIALIVGLHLPESLRLATESLRGMQVCVVIDLDERLERYLQAFGIVEYTLVVIRNAPRPWVQVKPVCKIAVLGGTAEFCITIPAPDSPGSTTRTVVVLEYLHVVARVPQLKRCDETGHARAEHENSSPLGRTIESDRSGVGRGIGEPQRAHALHHGGRAEALADQRQQLPAA